VVEVLRGRITLVHFKVETTASLPSSLTRTSPVSRPVYALPMAHTALSRRVAQVVAYPPLSELSDLQRREFHEALLDADTFEDLSGKWQAAILKAEQNRPDLRIVGSG
jgi:hypothetical protein